MRGIFCALAIAALALSPRFAQATGGYDLDDGPYDPRPAPPPSFSPLRLIAGDINFDSNEGRLPAAELEKVNQQEWADYFQRKTKEANLNFLIYKMKLADLDKLIWTYEGKKNAPALGKETAAVKADLDAVNNKTQVLRALYYLGFAKRCEPIATRLQSEDAWDQEKMAGARARDAETGAKLLAASANLVATTQDKFLQDRYRFQRLRLMFYTSRHDEAQNYYAANLAAFTVDSSVKYRFMHTAAGSFYRAEKYGRANYLYSQVFDHFPPLQETSYFSFRPIEDGDWKECLALAKNDHERAVLWLLVGLKNDMMAAMQKIYAFAPTSPVLELLLARAVNRLDLKAGSKDLAAIKRIADAKKTARPYLWLLTLGNIYAKLGNTTSASTYFDLAEQAAPKDPQVAAILRTNRLYTRIRAMKTLDPAQEASLATEMKWLESLDGPNAARFVLYDLGELYRKRGDSLRAALLRNQLPAAGKSEMFPDNRKLDQVVAFLQPRPDRAPIDEVIANDYSCRQKDLLSIKSLNELYAGHFKEAAELLTQAGGDAASAPIVADPFVIRIVDCHDCDREAKHKVSYTRLTFAQKLLELSQTAQRNDAEGAQASLQLANGLYNMTYYGNAREIYEPNVAPGCPAGYPDKGPSLLPNSRMDLAEKYYKRAMELSHDKEFKAKACFLAAKTEQNRFFNKTATAKPNASAVQPQVYFKKLKDSFSDTNYYKEIIKECGYFRDYLGKK